MTTLDRDQCLDRLLPAPVARLATVTVAGRPHLVPCCFAVVDDRIYSAVDGKPKSTGALKRLDNVRANPAASLIVDHYADDWTQLWWVRVDGRAGVVDGDRERTEALAALADKYHQYRAAPPEGAVLAIEVETLTGWAFAEPSEN